ncbi:hypothetical protein CHH69_16975 [Terribacillus saccharophilus]|uniref:hypothetical protein n=1 Tax=Terribacillus saccharophilus TaxID=361277 RepID=UPI000BC93FF1|nr:hypothetical protein [Terribacillus saccharophilus]PAF34223.1 hypothetical protein CHH69_16975 [Terribacillus saccharophilus]
MNMISMIEFKDWITIATSVSAATAAITAAVITSKAARKTSRDTISNLEQRRYIDAISIQRIDWINKLRDHFIAFNSAVQEINTLNIDTYHDNYLKALHEMNYIALLLNTTEVESKTLLGLMHNMTRELDERLDNVHSLKEYKQKIDGFALRITESQQIILKSEWKRVKEETRIGRELKEVEFSEIVRRITLDYARSK